MAGARGQTHFGVCIQIGAQMGSDVQGAPKSQNLTYDQKSLQVASHESSANFEHA